MEIQKVYCYYFRPKKKNKKGLALNIATMSFRGLAHLSIMFLLKQQTIHLGASQMAQW